MTDLESFIELYARFGIACNVNQDIETGNQFILLVERFSHYATDGYPGQPKPTKSDKLTGYSDFHSRIDFDQNGKFIGQGFWE